MAGRRCGGGGDGEPPVPCAVCGLDARAVVASDVAARVAAEAAAWGALLRSIADDDGVLRTRATDGGWSPIEIGGHVRDVLAVAAEDVRWAVLDERRELRWWDSEGEATRSRYVDDDPRALAADIAGAADLLGIILAGVERDAAWARAATWAEGGDATVAELARAALGDVHRHRHEAEEALRSRG